MYLDKYGDLENAFKEVGTAVDEPSKGILLVVLPILMNWS